MREAVIAENSVTLANAVLARCDIFCVIAACGNRVGCIVTAEGAFLQAEGFCYKARI